MFLLVTGTDELFPYQEMVLRRQMTNQQLVPGDGSNGARLSGPCQPVKVVLVSEPVQGRQNTA